MYNSLELGSQILNLIDSDEYIEVSWLFEIDVNSDGITDHFWSTKAKTWENRDYIFKIIKFDSIKMSRGESELSIQAPSELSFTVSNSDNTLLPSDFSGGQVKISLVIKADLAAKYDSTGDISWEEFVKSEESNINEAVVRSWRFQFTGVDSQYQTLIFRCRDWLQAYLQGSYPNTKLIHHLFPSTIMDKTNACVPVVYGKPFIPVMPVCNQLITNGDMEANSNWTAIGDPVSTGQVASPHTGDYSWSMGAAEDGGIKSHVWTTEHNLDDHDYILSLWLYTVDVNGNSIDVRISNGRGGYSYAMEETLYLRKKNKWYKFEIPYTEAVADKGTGAYLEIMQSATEESSVTTYIDDVAIDDRYYVLGRPMPAGWYGISDVSTPDDWEGPYKTWKSPEDFTPKYIQIRGADGNYFQGVQFPLTTDGFNLMFKPGDSYLPMNVRYSPVPGETGGVNPAGVLYSILHDWGIPTANIDWDSFITARDIYTSWGLEWDVGLWFQEPKKDLLSRLLTMCHTELVIRDKIYFKVHSKVNQHSVEKEWVLKPGDIGPGTFKYKTITKPETKDSGYVSVSRGLNQGIGSLINIIVPAKSSTDYISNETIRADYITASTNTVMYDHAQRIGILALQRRLLPVSDISFTAKGKCLQIECDDIIKIDPADYGAGTDHEYYVLVDSMVINKDTSVNIKATRFKEGLDDWDDLSPSTISIAQDSGAGTVQVVTSGPDITQANAHILNSITGKLRIGSGASILLDPGPPLLSFTENNVARLVLGDIATDDYGLVIRDSDGVTIMSLNGTGTNLLAGWHLSEDSIISTDSNIILDSANSQIRSGNYVSGHLGSGFLLSPNLLEVGNIACRGIFRTAVFQKDTISVVGGNMVTAKGADVLATDMDATDAHNLEIESDATFSAGDILRIKEGELDEWFEVSTLVSGTTYDVIRDKAGDYDPNDNPVWKRGAAVTNYGQSGDGVIYMTASEPNAPYTSVVTHAGSPWSSLTTQVRIGNLNGYLGYSSDIYGIGIGSSSGTDANLTFDPTNGLRLRCGTTDKIILANDGTITVAGISLDNLENGDYGKVLTTDITAGHIVLSECSGDLDDIANGTYGKVLTTAISAGKIVLSSAGVTGTLPTALTIAKCTDAAADQTSANTQNLGWLIGSTGSLTISSSGKLILNTANALEIYAAGNIKVLNGGDINLIGSDSNPGIIKFTGSSYSVDLSVNTAGTASYLRPLTANVINMYIGLSATPFKNIELYAYTDIYLDSEFDTNNKAYVKVHAETGTPHIEFVTRNNGTNETIQFFNNVFASKSGIYLGNSGNKWVQGWFSDYVIAEGGIHVGGTSDPGTDNLDVDGWALIGGNATVNGDIDCNQFRSRSEDLMIYPTAGVSRFVNKANNLWKDITCCNLNQSCSSRHFKKDILEMGSNDISEYLDKVKNTKVFSWEFKTEEERDKDKMGVDFKPGIFHGVVTEEAPDEIITKDKSAIVSIGYSNFLLLGLKASLLKMAQMEERLKLLEEEK